MSLILGNATATFSVADSTGAGETEAFQFTATGTGPVESLEFRTNGTANTGVTSLILGIFADEGGSPGAVLGQATASGTPAINSWIKVTGLSIAIEKGTKYWLGVLPIGGTLHYNVSVSSGGTPDKATTSKTLTKLEKTTWTTDFKDGPVGFQALTEFPTLVGKAAGGEWKSATTWDPEEVPTTSHDIVLTASSGNITVGTNVKCRSLDATNYKGTLDLKKKIAQGTSKSAGFSVKLGTGMTVTGSGEIECGGTAKTVEPLTSGGKEIPVLIISGKEAKIRLEDASKIGVVNLLFGELNTNNQECKWLVYETSGIKVRSLVLGTSKVVGCTSWTVLEGENFTAPSTGSIEMVSGAFFGGGKTYNKLIVATTTGASVKISNDNTFTELVNNSASKPTATIKGTLIEGSKALTLVPPIPTAGSTLAVGQELMGVGIAPGTTISSLTTVGSEYTAIEMSANATATVAVAENIEVFKIGGMLLAAASVQTVTTFTTNGKEGEPSRLSSDFPSATAKLKKSTGTVSVDYMIIRDSVAEGGATWEAQAHCINAGNNTGWTFVTGKKTYEGEGKLAIGVSSSSTAAKIGVGIGSLRSANTLTVTGVRIALGFGSVVIGVRLNSAGTRSVPGAGVLAVGVRTSATGSKVFGGSGSMSIGVRMTTAAIKTAIGSGGISSGTRITSTAQIVASGTGKLNAGTKLQGTGSKILVGTGSLRMGVRISTTSAAVRTGNGTLFAGTKLAVTGNATATGIGSLRVGVRISGFPSEVRVVIIPPTRVVLQTFVQDVEIEGHSATAKIVGQKTTVVLAKPVTTAKLKSTTTTAKVKSRTTTAKIKSAEEVAKFYGRY